MKETTILLIEDEKSIADIERKYFEANDYRVIQAFNGEEALKRFGEETVQLVILDLMLPKVSGEEVLRKIREKSAIPIIIVSAKTDEEDLIAGLRLGADDYMTKPFSPRELVERVKAVLRRSAHDLPKNILSSSDERIEIRLDEMGVFKDGTQLHLTKNEFLILSVLAKNPGKVFTREEIIELAFGMDYDAYDRAIDTHIKNIRQKLEDDPKNPMYVTTIYGIGYRAGGFA